MSVLSLLLQLCAIDWYLLDGVTLYSEGALVYPVDAVEDFAKQEQSTVVIKDPADQNEVKPKFVYKIRCPE